MLSPRYPSSHCCSNFMMKSTFEVIDEEGVHVRVASTRPTESQTGLSYDTVTCIVRLRRKPAFYLKNVVFFAFAITSASATTMLIPRDSVADRLQTTGTLLLSQITYKSY